VLVGYYLGVADSKSHMFRNDATLEKCPTCGYRLDFFAHNPRYRLRQDRYDLCATYDGQLVGSLAFKRFCEAEDYEGLQFLEFDTDELHFHVILENVVPFDAVRRKTRFEKLCGTCGNYESVVGVTPAYLKVKSPLADAIYRTDLLFASGNEKRPAKFVGIETKSKIEVAGLRGVYFHPAEGLPTP
jgi:hypothetical protein